MGRRFYHRKDGNHEARVKDIEELGYYWWDASQTNMGIDGFAVGNGRIIPIEFKLSAREKLTEKEKKTHNVLKSNGITVEVITDSASLEVLRLPVRNFYK